MAAGHALNDSSEFDVFSDGDLATDERAPSVHDLARQGNELDAQIEQFLDEVLLDDIRQTPLITMENVLEERRARAERAKRIKDRTQEMLQEEMAKQKHDEELRELEAAAAALRDPKNAPRAEMSVGAKAEENPFKQIPDLPFKLEGIGRSKDLKPYVANLTDFEPESHVKQQLGNLRSENELLQRCLRDSKRPGAFEAYLRSSSTF
ncbi:hypothetical protein AB1Y20_000782 [Prymnesium parvum]|uniref:Protein CASP n=1 Tax=Prymnesium parvum TaxID=97485 RepID=A0AB34K685_PRYPA